MSAAGVSPTGDPEAVALGAAWRDLAGRMGFPEIIETGAAVLPGSTTANVVYDLGVAVSLALGDLAEALDSLGTDVSLGPDVSLGTDMPDASSPLAAAMGGAGGDRAGTGGAGLDETRSEGTRPDGAGTGGGPTGAEADSP
ncbi:hypothetical protein BJY21_000716 [Kineosphaera limosa]|uniref:Uncharacterized protein n=1 Tax=Kineosphaera limosa NBRC 100340 TaxID=1184609 RepID=K6WUD9_9MICO|nr:hypothetical protein [Kineosphaera limosa]NYD99531.1 hypothetical protein [Kineosphaera limosa]GAB95712.1 hypothetical protein KILIM_025_00490 [Kineosphaera limosa NBRC 100340]